MSSQKQLEGTLAAMRRDGYAFQVQKNWNGTRDVHALTTKKGRDLYATLVPSVVVWADLTGEGTNGSTLPSGASIDEKGAKYTLTLQCGGDDLATLVPDADVRAGLEAAQTQQHEHFVQAAREYWEWVWDHADADEEIKATKAEGLKQVKTLVAMTRKTTAAAVPDDDPDVASMAKQNFVENAYSPFAEHRGTGLPVVKASQKVFTKVGDRRPPPRVHGGDGAQLNAELNNETTHVRRGMLVSARVRFNAWAFAGRYGVRADLVKVTVLQEGEGGEKRERLDDSFSEFAKRPKIDEPPTVSL